jgi:8-oxo-dGTP pyrophosphatase MutT (NUDIX family)
MTAAPSPAVVAPAATVILLRESNDDGGRLEVLLTQRAAGLSFMGGLWVFPGGRMEPADLAPTISAHATPSSVASLRSRMLDLDGQPLDADRALGLCVAACRETFEESGVLLARPRGSRHDDGDTALTGLACADALRDAATSADAFVELLVTHNLELEFDRLVYWAHWITPSMERKRFDTRFFAVQVPPGQQASVDRSELTQHAWLDEQSIEARMAAGDMRMAPPTIATLQDLWRSHARHGGLAGMLEAERAREVPPILPKLRRLEDGVEVLLPWDREYAGAEGEACVACERCPDYLAALPSRRRF